MVFFVFAGFLLVRGFGVCISEGLELEVFLLLALVSPLRLLRAVLGVFYKGFEAVVDGGNRVESSWVNRVKWGDFGMAVRCAILVAWATMLNQVDCLGS